MNSIKIKKIVPVIILIIWVIFIWQNSLLPADISGRESSTILELLRRMPIFGARLTGYIVRKAAHFAEYAVEAVILSGICREFFGKVKNKLSSVLLIGVFTAFIDETIQLFVDGRSGEIKDMWIDVSGFITGILLFIGFRLLSDRIMKKQ